MKQVCRFTPRKMVSSEQLGNKSLALNFLFFFYSFFLNVAPPSKKASSALATMLYLF